MDAKDRLRVAFVGNCQTPGIIASLKELLPAAEVEGWHFGAQPISGVELLGRLREFDAVIKNIPEGQAEGFFDCPRLAEHCASVIALAPVAFTGFHPDIAYLFANGRTVPGISGDYHSAIIAASYSLGLPPAGVPALFNALVYARLGYFDAFPLARQELIEQHRQQGYDLSNHVEQWLARGAFMYTINHPRIDVLSTLATIAAIRGGLVPPGTAAPDMVFDDLAASTQWPTYPELAQRIGVPGSMVFVRGAYEVKPGERRELGLREVIDIAYRIYDETPDIDLLRGRVAFVRDRLKELLVVSRR
jgi:hypothetical protein